MVFKKKFGNVALSRNTEKFLFEMKLEKDIEKKNFFLPPHFKKKCQRSLYAIYL